MSSSANVCVPDARSDAELAEETERASPRRNEATEVNDKLCLVVLRSPLPRCDVVPLAPCPPTLCLRNLPHHSNALTMRSHSASRLSRACGLPARSYQ
jgi:hypothetical protein